MKDDPNRITRHYQLQSTNIAKEIKIRLSDKSGSNHIVIYAGIMLIKYIFNTQYAQYKYIGLLN